MTSFQTGATRSKRTLLRKKKRTFESVEDRRPDTIKLVVKLSTGTCLASTRT